MSKKVLEVATEMIKTAKIKGWVNERSKGERLNNPTVTVFGWTPGKSPVSTPNNNPRKMAKIIAKNKTNSPLIVFN